MGHRARALLAASAFAFATGCPSRESESSGESALWLVNGLEVPVRVEVSGQSAVELAPDAHQAFRVPPGSREVKATTSDGKGHESVFVTVPKGGAALYSVAGAAPLHVRTDFFSKSGDAPEPRFETLCGQQTFTRKVDRYFEPALEGPASAGVGDGSRTTLGASTGGWRTCLNLLEQSGQDRAALAMMPAIRAMRAGKEELWAEAELRAFTGDEAEALTLLRGALASGDREHYFMYSQLGEALGKRALLVSEYRARARHAPDNLEPRYQLARLLPVKESIPVLQALVRERPEDSDLRMSLAGRLASSGRFKEALATLGPLGDGEKLQPRERFSLALRKVWILAALGRHEEAIRVIQADRTELQRKMTLLVQQGLLAQRLRRPDLEPDPKATMIGSDPWFSVYYDGQVHPERLTQERFSSLQFGHRVVLAMMKAQDDPKAALASVRRLTTFDAQFLPEPVAFLLIGEAWRAGDEAAAAVLRVPLLGSAGDLQAMRAYVLEGRRSQDMDVVWDGCAAIHLARSRLLRGRGNLRGATAEERLVRHDPYGGVATRALREWPPVEPGSTPPPPPPPPPETTTQLASAKQTAPRTSRGPRAGQPGPKPVEHVLRRLEGVTLEREP